MAQSALRTAAAGLIGNVLEWFDYAVYGYFSSEISKHFFPSTWDQDDREILTWVIFFMGFVPRAIGGLVLGLVGDRIGRRALLQRFRAEAEEAFLQAYDAVAREAAHRWVEPGKEKTLIDLFALEKVAYEVRYEAANRPRWLPIPLTGLSRIADRLLGPEVSA